MEIIMRLPLTCLIVAFFIVSLSSCGGGVKEPTSMPTFPESKPTGVDATAGNGLATLTWDAVPGAIGYNVYISESGLAFKRYQGELVYTTSFTIFDLENGKTYYFGVSAVGNGGWETAIAYPGGSPTASPIKPTDVVPEPPKPHAGPPDPPSNLQGYARDSVAYIWWDMHTVGDFDYYTIYRLDPDMTGYTLIEDGYDPPPDEGIIDYRDTDLFNDETYFYFVTAVDDEGNESDPSNILALTPLDLPPEPLLNMDILVKAGRIIIEWDVPEAIDIATYAIERVEPIDTGIPGTEIILRFLIFHPTTTFEEPDSYAEGFVLVYLDDDLERVVLEDRSVEEGNLYTYRIAGIDTGDKEGAPVEIVAPIQTY